MFDSRTVGSENLPRSLLACKHCGAELSSSNETDEGFCCRGCAGAYTLVQGLGLESYYGRRSVDASARRLRPEEEEEQSYDFSAHVERNDQGESTLNLMVEGIQCAACVWLIESLLAKNPAVAWARVNMTTRRLVVRWREREAGEILAPILRVGYRLVPFDPVKLGLDTGKHERELLISMAVAGFAAGNVMLFSVSVWAGHFSVMDGPTRNLMHWLSAFALVAVAYCIRPFARSAWAALSKGRTNMDVPITLGVLLASAMSLAETIRGGEDVYFDSAITLLFFLLIGRYLDSRARGRARSAAEHLLTLDAVAVTVLDEKGGRRLVPPAQVAPGAVVLVAAGERIGVDGCILAGRSDVDTSVISGETVPTVVDVGERVFAGMVNLSTPLKVTVTEVGERTLLAEIVRMMEVAEQGRAHHVALADRVARWYAPVVHCAALLTFVGWVGLGALSWQPALMNAVAVLIITCPCALALAVPVVQVIASGRLLRQGVLLKSATALERLAEIDTVVFDKTGTITLGKPRLEPSSNALFSNGTSSPWNEADLCEAASLAAASRHPLARSLVAAAPSVKVRDDVREEPGCGLYAEGLRLGSRSWIGLPDEDQTLGPELWLDRPGQPPVRFSFTDTLRDDAALVIARLRAQGLAVELLSGDRAVTVAQVAGQLGITTWQANLTPAGKVARLEALKAEGRKTLMVGDGLNDAPALAAAWVSASPSSAVDVSRTAADVVFQGGRLSPVLEVLDVAQRSRRLVGQNFLLALGYNVFTVPLAVAGLVIPMIAAIAMSTSSLLVIANALRLARRKTG